MFTKLLVPLDGSVESVAALPLARAMLGTPAAEVVLVRVVDRATSALLNSGDAAHECESYLNQVGDELRGGTTKVTTCVLFGSPGRAIVDAVSSLGVDLVVMATHGRGELGRLRFGSTAECVVGHSPVPVLVVRPVGRQVTHVQTLLVPLDGSPGGRRALAAATRLARQHGARLELLTVIQGMPGYLKKPLPGVDLGPVIAPAWNSARQAAAEVLQRTAERLGRHGIQASARAVIGDPTHEIVRAAELTDADVVVMSTHALAGPARSLLGSVAASVVRETGRPVLLVRRSAQTQSNAMRPPARDERGYGDSDCAE